MRLNFMHARPTSRGCAPLAAGPSASGQRRGINVILPWGAVENNAQHQCFDDQAATFPGTYRMSGA